MNRQPEEVRHDFMSMTFGELGDFVVSLGEKPYRAAQLFSWMAKGAPLSAMTNLPAAFRQKLAEAGEYRRPAIERKLVSAIDGTVKYLYRMTDGECVESVFMHYEHGTSLCVSSQAGCAMGCRFCASTLNGRARNLTASEILGQAAVTAYDTGERVDGIVLMGIGEPLDNYDNVVRFLRLISDERGMGIGLRHVSLSTCGLVPRIFDLAEEGLPVTLSVSLHASDDETRSALMPVNRRYPIASLLEACRAYFEKTGRRVSFEYTLIAGKNDGREDAARLAAVLKKGMRAPCHVNLILLNEVKETGLAAPQRVRANEFMNELMVRGVNATIRRRLGADINASCGQLRLSRQKADEPPVRTGTEEDSAL